jgi:hypothetical protein
MSGHRPYAAGFYLIATIVACAAAPLRQSRPAGGARRFGVAGASHLNTRRASEDVFCQSAHLRAKGVEGRAQVEASDRHLDITGIKDERGRSSGGCVYEVRDMGSKSDAVGDDLVDIRVSGLLDYGILVLCVDDGCRTLVICPGEVRNYLGSMVPVEMIGVLIVEPCEMHEEPGLVRTGWSGAIERGRDAT